MTGVAAHGSRGGAAALETPGVLLVDIGAHMQLFGGAHQQQRLSEHAGRRVFTGANLALENGAGHRGGHRQARQVGLNALYLLLGLPQIRASHFQIGLPRAGFQQLQVGAGLVQPGLPGLHRAPALQQVFFANGPLIANRLDQPQLHLGIFELGLGFVHAGLRRRKFFGPRAGFELGQAGANYVGVRTAQRRLRAQIAIVQREEHLPFADAVAGAHAHSGYQSGNGQADGDILTAGFDEPYGAHLLGEGRAGRLEGRLGGHGRRLQTLRARQGKHQREHSQDGHSITDKHSNYSFPWSQHALPDRRSCARCGRRIQRCDCRE